MKEMERKVLVLVMWKADWLLVIVSAVGTMKERRAVGTAQYPRGTLHT
jgi:hypothetical protein